MAADIMQTPVGTQVAQAWSGLPNSKDMILYWNQDINNTIYLGFKPQIAAGAPNTIPVPPNGSFQLPANRSVFVIGKVNGISPLVVIPNGGNMFRALTQALGSLAIPSVFSPNFVHGVSGWSINQDGSAEFNNVIVRGTFSGSNWIANANGQFFYNGTPAANNLVASIIPGTANVLDSFNNVALPGISVYQPPTGLAIGFFVQMFQGGINIGISAGIVSEAQGWTAQVSGLGATGSGILQYANDIDGNTYKAGRLILTSAPNQQIVSTTPVVINNMSLNVLAGFIYHITVMVIVSPDQAAGGASFGWDGSSVSGNFNGYGEWKQNAATPNIQFWDGSLAGLAASHAFAAGIEQVFTAEIWGSISTAGTFNLRAQESIAGDTYHIKSAIMRVEMS